MSYSNQLMVFDRSVKKDDPFLRFRAFFVNTKDFDKIDECVYEKLFSTYYRDAGVLLTALASFGLETTFTHDAFIIAKNPFERRLTLKATTFRTIPQGVAMVPDFTMPVYGKHILIVAHIHDLYFPFAIIKEATANEEYDIKWIQMITSKENVSPKTYSGQCFC